MESNLQIELTKVFNEALIYGRGILTIDFTSNGIEVKSISMEEMIKDLLEDLDDERDWKNKWFT